MSANEWDKIDEPLMEIDGLIKAILDKVNILDIIDKWGIEYSPCKTGEFTHRMKCPFPVHAFGDERTPSFFISEEQNRFCCFGCNSSGNTIDMIMLYEGKPFYEAAKVLAAHAGITSGNIDESLLNITKTKRKDPEHKIITHVFRAGIIIRNFLVSIKDDPDYEKWKVWADKKFIVLDKYLNKLEDDDWEIAKGYCDKINKYLKRKTL